MNIIKNVKDDLIMSFHDIPVHTVLTTPIYNNQKSASKICCCISSLHFDKI